MQLTLTEAEARTLRNIIQAYLPGLRREAAATDIAVRELRHELALRETLCERLLTELEAKVGPSGNGA